LANNGGEKITTTRLFFDSLWAMVVQIRVQAVDSSNSRSNHFLIFLTGSESESKNTFSRGVSEVVTVEGRKALRPYCLLHLFEREEIILREKGKIGEKGK
jgi:hypothetical protein